MCQLLLKVLNIYTDLSSHYILVILRILRRDEQIVLRQMNRFIYLIIIRIYSCIPVLNPYLRNNTA